VVKNIIELNGKKYDAVSGVIVDAAKPTSRSRPVIDSIMTAKPLLVSYPKTTVADPVAKRMSQPRTSSASHITAHQPERPKTLMRRSVHKPQPSQAAKIKVVAPGLANADLVMPTSSYHKLARSKQVNRHGVINRFTDMNAQPIAVPAAPRTKPTALPAGYNQQASPIAKSVPSGHERSQDLFDKAMASAHSHEQTFVQKHPGLHRGQVALLASAFAIIFLGGFLMYHSVPSMSLGVASAKAGFHASLPGYSPPGFSLGHFNYGPGSVTVNYHSNSDDRKFSVVQRVSSWDSAALLASFVKVTKQTYQTYQISGRTVYLYGDNNATWVDGGIWYVVNGDTGLSANQVLKMASSI
jgi:hypothetical protein